MATTKTPPEFALPGVTIVPQGLPFSFYQRGTDAFETVRVNGPVTLKLDDGRSVEGTIQSVQVGPLIDLLSNFGPQSVYTSGRVYSPNTLVQMLTDQAGGEVIDVTKLYTAFAVLVPLQPPGVSA